jgi:myosin heavy subunit
VTRARFPARFMFADFVRRFACLKKTQDESELDQMQQVHEIFKLAGLLEGHDYQIGLSKVFLRDGRIQVGALAAIFVCIYIHAST